ncbi:hypothetical protein BSKO_02281 [Bryopsis sp. KO-2023]|nr:hypothetical protein BSKO_02281 [Bryopsis sp. KO-2023]
MGRPILLALIGALLLTQPIISWGEDAADEPPSTDAANAKPQPTEHKLRDNAEKFEFQAEVNRLMDIIINSLYSNKDIFLRELISNASDALDKLRFMSLTDKSVLGKGDEAELDIRISFDEEKKVLKIRDKGIGMTKEDLVKNLGTIAKSGTSAFLEKIQKAGDLNLIGQFGVGFYSVYLVADFVEVVTKHNDDKQYIWESTADGTFAISEDTEGDPLGRGTQINIYLKDGAEEYGQEYTLEKLVKTYSEFINFPIYLYRSKRVEVDEEEDEDADDGDDVDEDSDDETEKEDAEDEDVEDAVIDDEEDDKKEKEKKYETRWDWERVNQSKALWLRNPSEVTDEEYRSFYKSVSKGYGDTVAWTHFKAEGDVEFRAILYIPDKAPFDFYDKYYENEAKSVKLYVRRVFISDDFDELLPRYLTFLMGVVDSDTLPLNISREMLQQHASLKTIKKKLIRKALDMLKKLAESEEKEEEDDYEDEEDKKKEAGGEGKYVKFWQEYGKALKMGIMEDSNNRGRLSKLLRFYSSKSPDKLSSLDEYVARMKEGQKQIYYLCGQSMDEVKNSPFLERLHQKGLEVIYFTESMDEYLMQHLSEYDDIKFQNASKENLKFGDKDDKNRKSVKKLKEEFSELTKWWKESLPSEVASVKVSNRLATSPCVVVASQYGWSANMERIMKAQAFQQDKSEMMRGKRNLEINPYHPIIKELKALVAKDSSSEATRNLGKLLYDSALLESGFSPYDPKAFADRLRLLMKDAIGMDAEMDDIEIPEEDEDDEEVEEEDDDGVKGEIQTGPDGEEQMVFNVGGEDLQGQEEQLVFNSQGGPVKDEL